MCTVSYIGDQATRTIPYQHPWTQPIIYQTIANPDAPTRAEYEALKREIEALKELLKAAKEYDDATGQPDCEVDEKIDTLRKLAAIVGIDLDEIFERRGD